MVYQSHGNHGLLRKFFRKVLASAAIALLGTQIFCAHTAFAQGDARPNILFIVSDDISWAHAGAYGDKVVNIRNFAPDRWPVGREFKDVDPSPTRTYILEHKAEIPRLFDLSFGKRPAEELYDLKKDPAQIVNVAAQARYRNHKQKLSARLEKYLKQTNDPRMGSDGDVFDNYPIWPRSNSNPQLFERIDRGAKAQE
jgi:hypothetical protein